MCFDSYCGCDCWCGCINNKGVKTDKKKDTTDNNNTPQAETNMVDSNENKEFKESVTINDQVQQITMKQYRSKLGYIMNYDIDNFYIEPDVAYSSSYHRISHILGNVRKSDLVKQYTSYTISSISKVRISRIFSQELLLGVARYVPRSSAPVCPIPIPAFKGKDI